MGINARKGLVLGEGWWCFPGWRGGEGCRKSGDFIGTNSGYEQSAQMLRGGRAGWDLEVVSEGEMWWRVAKGEGGAGCVAMALQAGVACEYLLGEWGRWSKHGLCVGWETRCAPCRTQGFKCSPRKGSLMPSCYLLLVWEVLNHSGDLSSEDVNWWQLWGPGLCGKCLGVV